MSYYGLLLNMKTAKNLWILSSLMINVVIGIYIYLQQNAPKNLEERFQYINDNWAMYGGHWKAEFLVMTLMLIGAIYFMMYWKSMSWTIISVGQLIVLLTYPIMLGGYENTPFELANMANQIATITFIFGNVIFFLGITLLYLKAHILQPWLRYVAILLSIGATLLFTSVFIGLITWNQVIVIAPLINILYLINAYYIYKIPSEFQSTRT